MEQVRPLLVATALLLLACGGDMFDDVRDFDGSYLEDARLVLDPDPKALRPSRFEPGTSWLVWLSAHRGGTGPLSETASRATIYFEFAERPAIGEVVDLATAPLQVSYESGGQKLTYISRTASGTLVLSRNQEGVLVIDLDVTFSAPILGEGEQTLDGEILLEQFTNF